MIVFDKSVNIQDILTVAKLIQKGQCQRATLNSTSWYPVSVASNENIVLPAKFRKAPTLQLREWKPYEIPINALFRIREEGIIATIIGVDEQYGLCKAPVIKLCFGKDTLSIYFHDKVFFIEDLLTLKAEPEISIDGGKTWQSARGVLEEIQE